MPGQLPSPPQTPPRPPAGPLIAPGAPGRNPREAGVPVLQRRRIYAVPPVGLDFGGPMDEVPPMPANAAPAQAQADVAAAPRAPTRIQPPRAAKRKREEAAPTRERNGR